MGEKKYTIGNNLGYYFHTHICKDGVEMTDGDVVMTLNRQQAEIERLEKKLVEVEAKNRRLIHHMNRPPKK